MKITPTSLPGVMLIEPDVFGDTRGFFMETWHAQKYAQAGLDVKFVQDNHSRSNKGILRGLHYQLKQAQGKLVRVSHGAVFDVVVDIRKGSPSFGQWVNYELSDNNFRQLCIPPGFAHGFCVLSETADFIYKCTDFYAPEHEQSILWNDPDIGIICPGTDFLVSEKDRQASLLKDMNSRLPVYKT